MVAAAQQLATALKGNIPAGNKTAEALTKMSELFTKIAAAKQAAATAKEQRNRLRANQAARVTTHLPRVDAPPPRVDVPSPRVAETPKADCRVVQIVEYPTVPRPVEQAPATVDPLIPDHVQTMPRSVSFTRQHHLNVAREPPWLS